MSSELGNVHSIETFGAVDGPGLRYVLFLQGCSLRCVYCHNPDCFENKKNRLMSVAEILQDIQTYFSYIKNGGVTISGGEPFLQANFVAKLLQGIKTLGLHTALDTSGYVSITQAEPVLQYTDLVLLGIKAIDGELFRRITGVSNNLPVALMAHLNKIKKPAWIRFALIPNLTDDYEHINRLAQYCAAFPNIEKVEVFPFHKGGEYKWAQLGYHYQLENTLEPTGEQVQRAKNIFAQYGLVVQ